ncbi:dna topoisomerase [Cystoisospora suis]|uniref:DNA topoisomerase (ATP-hydrolyzing) n=1 Tax=Cystoisospora suis TaxID=483139 RepID=A0A2C6KJV0_9APIC|nr:dna topoisomerase [Cystoisospora suis]
MKVGKTKGRERLSGIPKLEDANDAGGRHSQECTLILTEGDSAKTSCLAGLSVVGRDRFGVFPLRGKLLNVRDASFKQLTENKEIQSILKIVGLQVNDKTEDSRGLRYGSLMIMTDQVSQRTTRHTPSEALHGHHKYYSSYSPYSSPPHSSSSPLLLLYLHDLLSQSDCPFPTLLLLLLWVLSQLSL